MEFVLEGLIEAWRLVASGDAEVFHAVLVTFYVTFGATLLAAAAGFPYGVWLGLRRSRAATAQAFLLRYAMFLPTVIVGLGVYTLLSRRGILGSLDMLYTREAIIAGQFLLAFPVIGTFTAAAASTDASRLAYETARTLGASPVRAALTVMSESRLLLASAWLAAVARCYSELGVVATVGGNLRMRTRTLASTIQLELSKGEFASAIACGAILLTLALGFAVAGDVLGRGRRR